MVYRQTGIVARLIGSHFMLKCNPKKKFTNILRFKFFKDLPLELFLYPFTNFSTKNKCR